MHIEFHLGEESGYLLVQREKGDPKAQPSGFTREQHGWGAEIHLMGKLAAQLNQMGFSVCKANMQKDGHMYGDQWTPYVRTRKRDRRQAVSVQIYDGDYAIRSAAEYFNKGETVRFLVDGDIWKDADQPDWAQRVKLLCDRHGVICKLHCDLVARVPG